MGRLTDRLRKYLSEARVGRLATADSAGRPHVIPVCFAFDGRNFYTPIDKKPKKVAPEKLRRVRNILENHNVALMVDEYSEDWSNLRYVLIAGSASLLRNGQYYHRALRLLVQKYSQYQKMRLEQLNSPVIMIKPRKIVKWGKI